MTQQEPHTIGYGIIGTGRIAHDFAADLRHVRGTRLQAVLSRDQDTAKSFAKQHGPMQAYDSIDYFLKDPALDAVYIATPNSAHLPQALACIRAGKPVIVEKPLAMSAGAAQIIADEAAKAGVLVMEGMWIRFLPGIFRARKIIADREIGDITEVNGELAYLHRYDPESRLFSKALGGGAALDLGVYLLSLSIYLFGLPDSVEGSWQSFATGVDKLAAFNLRYPSFKVNLLTTHSRAGGNVFEIAGTKGVLRLEDPFIRGRKLRLLRGLSARLPLTRPSIDQPMGLAQKVAKNLPLPGQQTLSFPYPGHGLQFQAAAFADHIRQGDHASTVSPLSDSIAVLRMIESVLGQAPQ